MLVLSRKASERIRIGDDIVITVTQVRGSKARIGIEAPPDVRIVRDELPDLEDLRTFIENYDESIAELRIRSLLPIKELCDLDLLWDAVQVEVRSLCLAKVGKEASDLESEPGFILSLRALNNTLGKLWAERF